VIRIKNIWETQLFAFTLWVANWDGVRSVSGVRKSKGSGLGCGGGGVNWGWCHVNQTKYSRRNHGLRKKKVKENGEDI